MTLTSRCQSTVVREYAMRLARHKCRIAVDRPAASDLATWLIVLERSTKEERQQTGQGGWCLVQMVA